MVFKQEFSLLTKIYSKHLLKTNIKKFLRKKKNNDYKLSQVFNFIMGIY